MTEKQIARINTDKRNGFVHNGVRLRLDYRRAR